MIDQNLLTRLLVIPCLMFLTSGYAQGPFQIGSIKASESVIVVYDVSINAGTLSGTVIANTGSITTSNASTVSTNTINYTVVTCPPPIISASGPISFCAGGSVTLTAVDGDVSDPASGWQWYMDGSVIAGATSSTYVVSTSGSYKVEVTNSCAGTIQSAATEVIVKSIPAAGFTNVSSYGCEGSGGTATITFTGTPNYIVGWTLNGGAVNYNNTAAESLALSTPTASGIYEYSIVSITDATGCPGVAGGSMTVTVSPLITGSISGSTSVCRGSASPQVSFTATGGSGPYTFTYSVNGGGTQTITTVSGGTVTVSVATQPAGLFVYQLLDVQDATKSGCSQLSSSTVTITVNDLPSAIFTQASSAACEGIGGVVTITFTGSPNYIVQWSMNGGVSNYNNTASNQLVLSTPSSPGTYTYTIESITDMTGCIGVSGGYSVVQVNSLPFATVSGSEAVCQDGIAPLISFTGSGGLKPYTFSYNINGGSTLTITTTGESNIATVAQPTGSPGIYNYNLLSVKDEGSGCYQGVAGTATITVNPRPNGTISVEGSTYSTVCKGSSSPLVKFTGFNGTPPYTFNYTVNGGSVMAVTSDMSSEATVPVSTGTAGIYSYSLIEIKDASSSACATVQAGTVTVVVSEINASIIGSTTACINGNQPLITLSAVGGTTPYTFDYMVNNGGIQTATTVTGSSVAIPVSTANAGIYNFDLLSVTDAKGCINAVTGTATVTINNQPTANISGNTNICPGGVASLLLSVSGAGTITVTLADQNNTIYTRSGTSGDLGFAVIPVGPGTYTYTIVSVVDANCTGTGTGFGTIHVLNYISANIGAVNVSCYGAQDGSINVSGIAGGSGSYGVSIGSNYVAYSSNGNSFTGLQVGIYNVSVKDYSTGCIQGVGTVTIMEPKPIVLSANVISNSNCGSNTGKLLLSITGGSGSFVYRIENPTGITEQRGSSELVVDQLAAGIYTITSTDVTGCNSNSIVVSIGTISTGIPDLVLGGSSSTNSFDAPGSAISLEYSLANYSSANAESVVLKITKPSPLYNIDLENGVPGNFDNTRWSKISDHDSYVEFVLNKDPQGLNYLGCGGTSGVLRLQLVLTRSAGAKGKGLFTVTGVLRSSVQDANSRNNSSVIQLIAQ